MKLCISPSSGVDNGWMERNCIFICTALYRKKGYLLQEKYLEVYPLYLKFRRVNIQSHIPFIRKTSSSLEVVTHLIETSWQSKLWSTIWKSNTNSSSGQEIWMLTWICWVDVNLITWFTSLAKEEYGNQNIRGNFRVLKSREMNNLEISLRF